MSGIVVNGKAVEVPGVTVHNFLDDKTLALADYDGRLRSTKWVRNIVLHCTVGDAQVVAPGVGPTAGWWKRYPDIWASDRKPDGGRNLHGAHAVIDLDGVVGWYADALLVHVYHCGQVNNEYSVGIELKQQPDGTIFQVQIDTAIEVVATLCEVLGIQRQVHLPYHGRVASLSDGRDVVGIFGHRDCDANRGAGDPGNAVLTALVAKGGCERFDFAAEEDKRAWRTRQADLNDQGCALTVDGVPGPATCGALKSKGYSFGLWQSRP
jgi:hypothetical protein